MEKEQAYQDAARNYENAWKFGNQNNPGIGENCLKQSINASACPHIYTRGLRTNQWMHTYTIEIN
jgi:hypothetical protein